MAHKIIQCNCRGLRSNYNDLAILLQEHSPSAVCLQETNLKLNTNISFKNYSITIVLALPIMKGPAGGFPSL